MKQICSHGGPGGGSGPTDRRYFDPAVYRIVLLDQRGAGKSCPAAELKVSFKRFKFCIYFFLNSVKWRQILIASQ